MTFELGVAIMKSDRLKPPVNPAVAASLSSPAAGISPCVFFSYICFLSILRFPACLFFRWFLWGLSVALVIISSVFVCFPFSLLSLIMSPQFMLVSARFINILGNHFFCFFFICFLFSSLLFLLFSPLVSSIYVGICGRFLGRLRTTPGPAEWEREARSPRCSGDRRQVSGGGRRREGGGGGEVGDGGGRGRSGRWRRELEEEGGEVGDGRGNWRRREVE